jgi:hypothetical protein
MRRFTPRKKSNSIVTTCSNSDDHHYADRDIEAKTVTASPRITTVQRNKRKRLRRKRKHKPNIVIIIVRISLVFIPLLLVPYYYYHRQYMNSTSSTSIDTTVSKDMKNDHQMHEGNESLDKMNINSNDNNDDSINIIHIVNTRFMQHQPKLKILAKARLHLFKTFCLPSMRNQSIKNFIWIIKIDPELDESIKNELIGLINNVNDDVNENETNQKIYIIGTNINYIPGAWRGDESKDIMQNLDNGNVYTGDLHLLRNLALQSNNENSIILETRLDADDGLNKRYLELIQRDAKQIFYKDNIVQSTRWYFWCVEKHAKWYPDKNNEVGRMAGERRLDYCITPGLTVGFNVGTLSEEIPIYGHHKLYYNLAINKSQETIYDCKAEECISFVTKMVAAVRSRTDTSAGMEDTKYISKLEMGSDMIEWIWAKLQNEFGVPHDSVIEMHKFLQENWKEIAKENLAGQCTDGHSCKKGSQDRLKRLIEQT